MATFKRFEDIEGWKKARLLTNGVYRATRQRDWSKDFPLRDQIRRAAISTMSNIAEGFERGGSSEFIQFLSISKGSAGEVASQLYVALDEHYIGQEEFQKLYDLALEIGRMLGRLMIYLRNSPFKGQKYKRATQQTPNPKPQTRDQLE